jgi:excisionase family DNA binding protein
MAGPNDNLTIEEVARELRAPLSSVRQWIRTGKLRSFRPGKRRLVRRVDIEAFIHSTMSTTRGWA